MRPTPVFSLIAFCAAIGCALAMCASGFYPSIFAWLAGVYYAVVFFLIAIITQGWKEIVP
jgi:hypothetical protein